MVSESVRYQPPPALRPLVAWYSGYREAGVPPARHRGLPSPYLTLIITLDDPLIIAEHPDPRQPASRHGVLVGGLHTGPALITHDGRQSGIQLQVTPLGARALLGLPAGELASLDLEADDILGPFAAELHNRIRAAGTWAARFAVVDDLLARRTGVQLTPGAVPAAGHASLTAPSGSAAQVGEEVAYAWRALLASRGAIPIADLARETGWSARHLGGRFRDEFGLTPKAAARVVRFDRARRLLQRRVVAAGTPALADLAAAGGYYDQAHLAREFRELAGCAPSRWLAEEFRNVQAGPAGVAEGSQP
jgi:AraC-like DNA-binding protein